MNNDNRTSVKTIVFAVALLLLASAVVALPTKIPINGRLAFSNDTDVNGTANFTFKIYNNKTGGSLLWQETQQNLTVRRGLLSAYIGNNTPINLSFDENYFLEVAVNGETVEPRFEFGTTGYSFVTNQTILTKNDTKALGNITPVTNNTGVLGSNSVFWLAGYFVNLFVYKDLNATEIFLGGTNLSQRLISDNTTQNARISTFESDNTTQAALIGQKLNLTGGTLSGKLNISTTAAADNLSLAVNETLYVNGSGRVGIGTSSPSFTLHIIGSFNVSQGISCGMITGGTDSDYCTDETAAGSTSDNTTQNNLITANNNTLTNLKANLTTLNNFTAAWNWFANVTADIVNVTTGLFSSGINYITRINSNNQTIVDNLSSTGTRIGNLETRQSSDNTTQAENLTTTNTRIGNLETKQTSDNTTIAANISTANNRIGTLETKQSSDNTTLSNLKLSLSGGTLSGALNIGNVSAVNNLSLNGSGALYVNASTERVGVKTTNPLFDLHVVGTFNVSQGISCGMITGGSDGDYCVDTSAAGADSDNTTQKDAINTKVNITDFTSNNNTLTAVLGQKLNLTGGTLSSLLTILGANTANNLSLNVNNTLYVNASLDRVGVGTSAPSSRLDVSGTLTVETINVTGRQISDNNTIAGNLTTTNTRIGNLETRQTADNTTVASNISTTNTRIGNLETRQSSDNTTIAANISTANNRIGALETKQGSDNTTLSNLKLSLSGGTMTGALNIGNVSAVNNLSLNASGALYVNASTGRVGVKTTNPLFDLHVVGTFNVSTGISCGMLTGGTDGDFCVDTSAAGADSDNTTQKDAINTKVNITDFTSNNNTITNNLSTTNTRIGNLETKQTADNTTVANNISTTNARIGNLETKQSSDNTTLTNLKLSLSGGTMTGALNIVNVSAVNNLSLNGSGALYVNASTERVGVKTTNPLFDLHVVGTFNVSQGISCGMITGGSDTDYCVDAAASISDNTTQDDKINANNQTLTNLKFNVSGGVISGMVNVSVSDSNNNTVTVVSIFDHVLSVAGDANIGVGLLLRADDNNSETENLARIAAILTNANNGSESSAITFTTRTAGGALTERLRIIDTGFVGVGITVPYTLLHVAGNATVNGTLTVEGINVTGRQISDNTTTAALLGQKVNITDWQTNNNTIQADLGLKQNLSLWLSNNNTIWSDLGLKQNLTLWLSNNNTIWSDLGTKVNITLWQSNNNTIQADLGKKVNITDQTADNQTLTNLKYNVSGGPILGTVNITGGLNVSAGGLVVHDGLVEIGKNGAKNLTLKTANLNVTQNITVSNVNPAGNNSAIRFYDTDGFCKTRMYYNGTHFVIDGC